MKDFTLNTYEKIILALKNRGYKFLRFLDLNRVFHSDERLVILRHDVDRLPGRAMDMAALESSYGILATYFFRIKPCSFNPAIINKIHSLSHEIGYHYEELAEAKGNAEKAWALFKQNLEKLRTIAPIQSIAMHGRPLSSWDNRSLWKQFDYTSEKIACEAYLDTDWSFYQYFTDVGRSWNNSANLRDHPPSNNIAKKNIRTSYELIQYIETCNANLVLSMHPERWVANNLMWGQVWIQDKLINVSKKMLRSLRA